MTPDTQTEGVEANGHRPEPFTPKQLARLLSTDSSKVDARTVRKFMRSQFGKVGQGNRWGLDPADVEAFTEAWLKWRDRIEARKLEAEVAEIVESNGQVEDEMEVGS